MAAAAILELIAQADACLHQLDVRGALQAAGQALAAAREPDEIVAARYTLARCHYVGGEIDVAVGLAAQASAAAELADDPVWLGRSRMLEARCLERAGETGAALDLALLAMQALDSSDRSDETAQAARQAVALGLGVVYLRLADLASAMQWCERAIELARPLQNQAAFGASLDTQACVHSALAEQARERGDAPEAEREERAALALSTQAMEVARSIGHIDHETTALLNLVESLTLLGEPQRALEWLEDWQHRLTEVVRHHRNHHRYSLGHVYLAMDRPADAVVAFEEALAAAESDSARVIALERLSLALERCGRLAEALAHYKRYHAMHSRLATEQAQRNARVATVRLDIERERARARQLASSNQQLRERAEDLARLATEDALTGLPNRRRVEQALAPWPANAWAALIDADHFKRVNDEHSHATGDAVLKQLAQLMRANCRPQDLPARLGGEEFLVLFQGDADAEISHAAERLREAVEAFDWSLIAPGLHLTVSIGLAHASEAPDAHALLDLADRRLYMAKHRGRNRVVARD